MTEPDLPRPRTVRDLLICTLCYSVLALVLTWPLALHLDSHILGGYRDGPMFLWNHWWGGHAVFDLGQNPLRTEHLYHPYGTSLSINTHTLLPSLLAWPVTKLFGVLVAFNVSTLLTFVVSGVGAWLLVHEILEDRRAAFVAGVAFAFCHFRSSFVMFHNLGQSQFLVLYCWAVWATFKRNSWKHACLTAVFAAALLYSSYTLAVLAAAWTIPLLPYGVLWTLAKRGWRGVLELGFKAVALLVAALALSAPLALEMKSEIDEHGNYASMRKKPRTDVTVEEDVQRPKSEEEVSALHRYVVRGPLAGGPQMPTRRASYLGWSVLGLALIGLLSSARRVDTWLWLLIAVFFVAASLGKELDLTGFRTEEEQAEADIIRMPYSWLRDLPILNQVRIPHRYGVVGCLGLAVLAGFGWQGLQRLFLRLWRHRPAASVSTAACSLVVFFDFATIPFPTIWELPSPPPPLAEAFQAIREDPRECCVMEFPAGRRGHTALSWYDTLHQKPVYLDGQVARRQRHLEETQEQSALREAINNAFNFGDPTRPQLDEMRPILRKEVRDQRIGWLIIAWDRWSSDAVPEKSLRKRCRALTKLIRGTLLLDGDFVPSLADSSWGDNGNILRCPTEQVSAWASLPRRKQRSAPAILLVVKLRWE